MYSVICCLGGGCCLLLVGLRWFRSRLIVLVCIHPFDCFRCLRLFVS